LHAWSEAAWPLRLHELSRDKADAEAKALACYGLMRAEDGAMWLRFVAGRPVSAASAEFLAWVCERLALEGKKALLLVWDNASWHVSKLLRDWIKAHDRQAKEQGGVRILLCRLPVKSPWLEPHRVALGPWQARHRRTRARPLDDGIDRPHLRLFSMRELAAHCTTPQLKLQ
jgi:hypothetical protein